MSTRSEIRFFKNGKQEKCAYHHSDGYPEHIISDLVTVEHDGELMKRVAQIHGTAHLQCAFGDKSKKHQGDIEYSYDVHYKQEKPIKQKNASPYQRPPTVERVDIYSHPFTEDLKRKKIKIFSGDLETAWSKYVCKKE